MRASARKSMLAAVAREDREREMQREEVKWHLNATLALTLYTTLDVRAK